MSTKNGYKIYLPSQNNIIKSGNLYFISERLCITSVTVDWKKAQLGNVKKVRMKTPIRQKKNRKFENLTDNEACLHG